MKLGISMSWHPGRFVRQILGEEASSFQGQTAKGISSKLNELVREYNDLLADTQARLDGIVALFAKLEDIAHSLIYPPPLKPLDIHARDVASQLTQIATEGRERVRRIRETLTV